MVAWGWSGLVRRRLSAQTAGCRPEANDRTPLASSSPRARENAEQIETHLVTRLFWAVLECTRRQPYIASGPFFLTRANRPRPTGPAVTDQSMSSGACRVVSTIPAPAPAQCDFSAPATLNNKVECVQGYFLPTIPPFPDVAAASRGPAAVLTSGETSIASLPASRPMAPLLSAAVTS